MGNIVKEIPVIDLESHFIEDDIYNALVYYGFLFYPLDSSIVNSISKTFEISYSFFSLDKNSKIKCGEANNNNNGRSSGYYYTEEHEADKCYNGDIKEAFQLLKNPFSYSDDWPHKKWPDCLPEMAEVVNKLYESLTFFSNDILKLISKSLRLSDDCLLNLHSQNKHYLRLLRYPAPNHHQISTNRYWCGEHFDYGTITLLFQSGSGGIQVNNNGHWIDAPNKSGYVLINAGSALKELTGGLFKAAYHRVPFPIVKNYSQIVDRYSIAFFIQPDYNAHIKNLLSNDVKYVTSQEFLSNCIDISTAKNSGYKP